MNQYYACGTRLRQRLTERLKPASSGDRRPKWLTFLASRRAVKTSSMAKMITYYGCIMEDLRTHAGHQRDGGRCIPQRDGASLREALEHTAEPFDVQIKVADFCLHTSTRVLRRPKSFSSNLKSASAESNISLIVSQTRPKVESSRKHLQKLV